jgi:hypothetical protein
MDLKVILNKNITLIIMHSNIAETLFDLDNYYLIS